MYTTEEIKSAHQKALDAISQDIKELAREPIANVLGYALLEKERNGINDVTSHVYSNQERGIVAPFASFQVVRPTGQIMVTRYLGTPMLALGEKDGVTINQDSPATNPANWTINTVRNQISQSERFEFHIQL